MENRTMKPLILCLDNELKSIEGLCSVAAKKLKIEISSRADIMECCKSGMELMEILYQYERVIIIDTIRQNNVNAGTIIEITPRMLKMIPSPSPRYTGLPEMFERAERMNLRVPAEIRIFAVTTSDPEKNGGAMSAQINEVIPELICRVKRYLQKWENVACE